MQDLLDRLKSEYLDNKEILWNSASLKIKDGTMNIWTFKFPNNWGLIVRRIVKANDQPTTYAGFIDNICFHDNYYFDRPKGKSEIKNYPFATINELLVMLDNCRSLPKYESK